MTAARMPVETTLAPVEVGRKFKKCHGAPLAVQNDREYAEVFSRQAELPKIEKSGDIASYLDAYVGTFQLLQLPSREALLHSLRAVQTLHGVGDSLFWPHHSNWQRIHYRSLRTAQDTLRYLPYEILKRCPKGGSARGSTLPEIKLATVTASHFSRLSEVRDSLEAYRAGFERLEIDARKNLVTFEVSESPEKAAKDVARRHHALEAATENVNQAQAVLDSPRLRAATRNLYQSVSLIPANFDLSYRVTDDIVDAYLAAMEVQIPYFLSSDPLPEAWSLGPYTIGDYRKFWTVLEALVSIHSMVFYQVCAESKGAFVPHNAAILSVSKSDLVVRMCQHAQLPEEVALEIVRDLTYDPERVLWTEVQYQPLVSIQEDEFGLVPLVVGGSNFERNLLALIDRLPWRKNVSHRLKDERENLMIAKIEGLAKLKGFNTRARILIGDAQRPVGDVDLLMWRADPPEAMAISLKWFYGPDSVREMANHSERYREGLARHRRVVEQLWNRMGEISRRYSLVPNLPDASAIYPAFVTYQDEVLERDRIAEIPTITLSTFLRLLEESDGSLQSLYTMLQKSSSEGHAFKVEAAFHQVLLGNYRFRIQRHRIVT